MDIESVLEDATGISCIEALLQTQHFTGPLGFIEELNYLAGFETTPNVEGRSSKCSIVKPSME